MGQGHLGTAVSPISDHYVDVRQEIPERDKRRSADVTGQGAKLTSLNGYDNVQHLLILQSCNRGYDQVFQIYGEGALVDQDHRIRAVQIGPPIGGYKRRGRFKSDHQSGGYKRRVRFKQNRSDEVDMLGKITTWVLKRKC